MQRPSGRAVWRFGGTALAVRRTPHALSNDQQFRASLQRHVTPSEFDAMYAAGEAMDLDQVLADILNPANARPLGDRRAAASRPAQRHWREENAGMDTQGRAARSPRADKTIRGL